MIQIKALFSVVARMRTEAFEGCELVWSSTRILWDQQILLLWILLVPVFFGSALLAVAAPLFFRDGAGGSTDNDVPANQEDVERKAA
jgi:hypothetical protein